MVIPFHKFPNQKYYLYDGFYYWTLSPFLNGDKLDYRLETNRESALKTVRQFHQDTEGILFPYPRIPETYYKRWTKRLKKFQTTHMVFQQYGFKTLFDDIVRTVEAYLHLLNMFDWEMMQIHALQAGSWNHGDLAGHNFLRYGKKVYLIDFDLLTCSPALYDYIQLGQRFLPYLNWDIERLLAYHMVDERYLNIWLYAICTPSDVMRDWLYHLRHHSGYTYSYLVKMETNWIKRRTFLKNVQSMLN